MDDQNQFSDEQKFLIDHIKVEQPEEDPYSHQEIQTEPNSNETIKIEETVLTCDVSTYECKFCEKIFSNESSLKHHLNEYHLIFDNCDGKPFKCKQAGCSRSFKINRDLTQHLKVHIDEKPYQCQEDGCLKSFKRQKNLNQHMKVHSGQKPFQCQHDDCTKTFKVKGQLKVHMLAHSEAKPEKCLHPGCKKSFKTRYKLKVHMRYHSNVVSYKCNFIGCSKFFRDKRNLQQHMAVHSDERTFKCKHQGCTKAYKNQTGLIKHMHSEEKKKKLGLSSIVRFQRDEVFSKLEEEDLSVGSGTSIKQEPDGDDEFQEQKKQSTSAL